jgi:hypothetical protein
MGSNGMSQVKSMSSGRDIHSREILVMTLWVRYTVSNRGNLVEPCLMPEIKIITSYTHGNNCGM